MSIAGDTPLIAAARHGRSEIVDKLLAARPEQASPSLYEQLLAARPDAREFVEAVKSELPELDADAAAHASELEHRCLQALALMDGGRFDEALATFNPARERGSTHPAARFVADPSAPPPGPVSDVVPTLPPQARKPRN